MFHNFNSKCLLIIRRALNKQSLFKRQLLIKNDTKNSSIPSKEKMNGDIKDIEVIENLMLNKGIQYIIKIYVCI